jgi:CBS domain-containing protein
LRAIAQGKNGKRSTVGEHAVKRLTTVTASAELLDAARVMREKGFRHLVVVDDSGDLVGVFSMRDLVVGLLEELRATASVAASDAEGPAS